MAKIVLLHGALGSKENFANLLPYLDCYDLEVIEFPGHGNTLFQDRSLSISQLTEFVAAKITEPVSIFGFSLGGYVALNLALTYPEKVVSILTLATKFNWSPQFALQEVSNLNSSFLSKNLPSYFNYLKNQHGEKLEQLLSETGKLMMDLGNHPILTTENIPKLSIPVRIAVGDKDRMVSMEESFNTFKNLKLGSFAVLPGTKHPLESIDNLRLAFEIKSFLQSTPN